MKTHTSAYKNTIKEFGRQLDSIITYSIDDEVIELGSNELNSITPHYEGAILKSTMKQLDIDSNVEIPIGTEINYVLGAKVRDEEVEDYRDNYDYIDFGNYIVYSSEKQEDNDSYSIVCYDKMLYSMKDYETLSITYPTTIRNYINAIATYMGLTFANINDTFPNYNKVIDHELYLSYNDTTHTYSDSMGYTFRDVLDELSQVTASTICINDDDELELRYITQTNDTIDENYLKDINVNFGEKYGPINSIVLSRAGDSDRIYLRDEQSVTQNGLCEIKISENQIMNFNDRDTYLPDILVTLDGLEYYTNDYSSTGITYYDLCDRYSVSIGENTYSCVMFNDEVDITQGLEEKIHTDMPEESVTDYTKADKTDRKLNQAYIIVDKQNQTIQSVVSNVTEQNNKISQITQTVDELNTKISDIADITISGESEFATFTLDNINESEPITIKVKPINANNNISYIYPNSNLYPSSNLYTKTRAIRFTNRSEYEITQDTNYTSYRNYYSKNSNDEYELLVKGTDYQVGNTITGTIYQNVEIDYILPDDLLYYDSEHYDEFYLDYDSDTCQVTKRCKYNADGTVGLLSSEQIDTYPYPTISLTNGDYTLQLLGYEYGYLFVRLMASNIYTSQFATRVELNSAVTQSANEIRSEVSATYSTKNEMNSAISQTAGEINLEVAKKTNKTEIISTINQSAEQIQINANKISLAGKTIQLTSDNIAIASTRFNLDKNGNLTCSNANVSGTITSSNATITGGTLHMTSDYNTPSVYLNGVAYGGASSTNYIAADGMRIRCENKDLINMRVTRLGSSGSYHYSGSLEFKDSSRGDFANIDEGGFYTGQSTYPLAAMYSDGEVHAAEYTGGSLESIKKNIKLYKNDALELINKSDIYEYNLKEEKDDDRKHIGLVIGDGKKKYNTPKEIISKRGDGIDLYSMLSLSWKAIQEQQEQIEKLQKELQSLKESDK